MITFEDVRNNKTVIALINQADYALEVMGLTDHSLAHVGVCAEKTAWILEELGYDQRTIELGKIAAIMHDIGNAVNRKGHAHHGATMAFTILDKMGMEPKEIAEVITAIGYHDEESAYAITPINSALILADKSDVRFTRVRNYNPDVYDIHDRVNFAVKKTEMSIDQEKKHLILKLEIDTEVSSVADYFEIFLGRMLLCRKAATFFDLNFKLDMNGTILL